MLTEYVAGFMFRRSNSEVALVRKNKPDWQRGKLNGIGGKVEESDCGPHEAMAREFLEETGVATSPAAWSKVAVLDTPGARIHFFRHETRPSFDRPRRSLLIGIKSASAWADSQRFCRTFVG